MSPRICGLSKRYGDSRGAGVRVAVVDSGVEADHPDLAGVEVSGVVVQDRGDKTVLRDFDGIDVAGHGTACAGLINRVAPEAAIVSCRVLNQNISTTSRALLVALDWVLELREIDVVNLSLGTSNPQFGLEIAKRVDALYAAGVPVVVARGYEAQPDYPSAFGSPVSVSDEPFEDEDELCHHHNDVVEFGAKGYDLVVPWRQGRRVVVNGSSFAAPLVAGRLARFKALDPELKVWELKTLLHHQAIECMTRRAVPGA